MLREAPASIATGLARRYAAPRWALLPQVPTHTGPRDGARIVDYLAVDLWLHGDRWGAHMIDEKVSAHDTAREAAQPEKSAPFRAFCAFWWIAAAPGHVQAVKRHVPEGWGLLSVGTGEPRVILQAPEHDVVAPPLDIVRGMLRASANAAPPPAAGSKILERRVPRSLRAEATRLDVALAAIDDASPEQLTVIAEALAGRRAA